MLSYLGIFIATELSWTATAADCRNRVSTVASFDRGRRRRPVIGDYYLVDLRRKITEFLHWRYTSPWGAGPDLGLPLGPLRKWRGGPGPRRNKPADCKFLAKEWSRVRRLPVASSRSGKNVSLEVSWHAQPLIEETQRKRGHTQFGKCGLHLLLFGEIKEAVRLSPTSQRFFFPN